MLYLQNPILNTLSEEVIFYTDVLGPWMHLRNIGKFYCSLVILEHLASIDRCFYIVNYSLLSCLPRK
jgi:hypothetical protein